MHLSPKNSFKFIWTRRFSRPTPPFHSGRPLRACLCRKMLFLPCPQRKQASVDPPGLWVEIQEIQELQGKCMPLTRHGKGVCAVRLYFMNFFYIYYILYKHYRHTYGE